MRVRVGRDIGAGKRGGWRSLGQRPLFCNPLAAANPEVLLYAATRAHRQERELNTSLEPTRQSYSSKDAFAMLTTSNGDVR